MLHVYMYVGNSHQCVLLIVVLYIYMYMYNTVPKFEVQIFIDRQLKKCCRNSFYRLANAHLSSARKNFACELI